MIPYHIYDNDIDELTCNESRDIVVVELLVRMMFIAVGSHPSKY